MAGTKGEFRPVNDVEGGTLLYITWSSSLCNNFSFALRYSLIVDIAPDKKVG